MTIKKKLIKNAKKVDKFLINFLKKQKSSLLLKPMKYGVISGGKKIRTTIILDTGKLFNLNEKIIKYLCRSWMYPFLFFNSRWLAVYG